MKRSFTKMDYNASNDFLSQGMVYRITLGEKEIKVRLVDKEFLEWDDIPEYGRAVASIDTLDVILMRDSDDNILCLCTSDEKLRGTRITSYIPKTHNQVWYTQYTLYHILTKKCRVGADANFYDYRDLSPLTIGRQRWAYFANIIVCKNEERYIYERHSVSDHGYRPDLWCTTLTNKMNWPYKVIENAAKDDGGTRLVIYTDMRRDDYNMRILKILLLCQLDRPIEEGEKDQRMLYMSKDVMLTHILPFVVKK